MCALKDGALTGIAELTSEPTGSSACECLWGGVGVCTHADMHSLKALQHESVYLPVVWVCAGSSVFCALTGGAVGAPQ